MQLVCPHCGGEFHLEAPDAGTGENQPLPVPDKLPFFGSDRKKVFGQHFEHLAADGTLSDEDKRHLAYLAANFGLSEKDVNSVQGELFMREWKPIQERLNSTRYVSEADLALIEALKRKFGVTLETDQSIQLAHGRWRLDERGELPIPVRAPSALLSPGESAYWEIQSTWHQVRSVRKGYIGGSAGIRIAKGVRIGASRAIPISEQQLTPLSTGVLTVTEKRLLFQGGDRTTTILLGRITGTEVFREGLMIHKDRGVSDLFSMPVLSSAYLDSLVRRLIDQG